MYPYLIQGSNIIVVIDNKSHTISKSHFAYEKIKKAIKKGKWDKVKDLIEPKKVVLDYGEGNVSIKGDTLYWRGEEMHCSLSQRMIQMIRDDFPIEPLVKFMDNLQQNPSHRAVNELYTFLEGNNLPITPDGHFLAYKRVRDSYYDCHSGTVLNKPFAKFSDEDHKMVPYKAGVNKNVRVSVENDTTVVQMPRNRVDDDKTRTCSDGLHFCSLGYLDRFYGERIVIMKVNPADVVSIPVDYGFSKGRCWKYQVVGELNDRSEADDAFEGVVHDW